MPQIDHVKPELGAMLPDYKLIDDCIAGQRAIKMAPLVYLPMPQPQDQSEDNLALYRSYTERAVFYNVAGRTLEGFIGQVFAADVALDVPQPMEVLKENINGAGLSFDQLAKTCVRSTLARGRAGLFVDFPLAPVGRAWTAAEVQQGIARPSINFYAPTSVINWRTTTKGTTTFLSLVVLAETYEESDDGFKVEVKDQWRVLSLEDNRYKVEVYRKSGAGFVVHEGPFYPTDNKGNPVERIPFTFVGAVDNTPTVDRPPMLDICNLNVAHYRNSADYEDSCFMVGQPTPWFSGLTEQWVKNQMKGKVMLGSRAAIPLPTGAQAGLLQPEGNTMPMEAMIHKEKQMVALGAKLVENREVQRTATEAGQEEAGQTSALAAVVKNSAAALTLCLRWCAGLFYGMEQAAVEKVWATLPTDFAISRMSPEERGQLLKEWQAGAIADSEYRTSLRASGVAELEDDEWKEEVENSSMRGPELDPLTDDEEVDPANPAAKPKPKPAAE